MKRRGITELDINHAKGFTGSSIEFLERVPVVRCLGVATEDVEDFSPLHALHELRALSLWTGGDRSPLDFDQFPFLESCDFEWRPRAKSLFNRTTLRRLYIDHYSGHDTDPFAGLTNLEELTIATAPIRDLSGLSGLKSLRTLGMYLLTRLESLRGIEGLTGLTKLNIRTCRKITSIDEIAALSALESLTLANCGDIATLRSVERLQNLKHISFAESTNIVDGDMTPLERIPGLKVNGFINRGHYNRVNENFPGPWFNPAVPRPVEGSTTA
jgi:Leucine-rich repeat (LRR) protein